MVHIEKFHKIDVGFPCDFKPASELLFKSHKQNVHEDKTNDNDIGY